MSTEVERESFLLIADPRPLGGLKMFAIDATLARHILRVAMPAVLGMLSQTAINVLDTILVGRLPKEVANAGQTAIGFALPIMWLVGGFLASVWVGTQAITARRAGEGNARLAGRALTNSLAISTTVGVALPWAAYFAAPAIVSALYTDASSVALGTEYLQIRLLGVMAMACTFSYKSFFDGIGRTKIFMVAAVVMNVANFVLAFLLIFGSERFGIQPGGVAGAAWAAVISSYLGLGVLVLWSLRPHLMRRYHYYDPRNLDGRLVREIARLSWPNGAATIVVMIGFEALYWVVGQVNDRMAVQGNPVVGAANQAIIALTMVTFMSSIAFGIATATLAGQSLGARRPYLAERYGWEAVKLWAYAMGVYGVAMIVFPDILLSWITIDAEVIDTARGTLRMLGLLQGVIAIALVLAQTLFGLGQARFVLYVELGLHVLIMAPVGYLFGVGLDLGLMGIHAGVALYGVLMAAAMIWKFKRGDWKDLAI